YRLSGASSAASIRAYTCVSGFKRTFFRVTFPNATVMSRSSYVNRYKLSVELLTSSFNCSSTIGFQLRERYQDTPAKATTINTRMPMTHFQIGFIYAVILRFLNYAY